MSDSHPLFIADSCIGGLSVLRSIWSSGNHCDTRFLADYAINPLGIKPDAVIAEVAGTWLQHAAQHSRTLVIGCNTLSIRYHQLPESRKSNPDLEQVISMVDCFQAMIEEESGRLENSRVLIVGTLFTANQPLYPSLLTNAVPGVKVTTVAATELERSVARFEPWVESEMITPELREALSQTDFAILACTCFPIAAPKLKALFPEVEFIDPGAYVLHLLDLEKFTDNRRLDLSVTGELVSKDKVTEFADRYLPS